MHCHDSIKIINWGTIYIKREIERAGREEHRDMFEGKAVVRETDMPEEMQCHAAELAYQALDLYEPSDHRSIAYHIKQVCLPFVICHSFIHNQSCAWHYYDICVNWQEFDEAYGAAWHCVVGSNFGSCITHVFGNFIFFHVEMMEILVFKDGSDLEKTKEEAVGVAYDIQKQQQEKENSPLTRI